MPKRSDFKKILLIGSGPIVIGQACEFDYSGTQAIKALKEEGFTVVLANSNPATIMTDPHLADRVYIEPLTPKYLEKIIAIERPDALLPTMGGQTALNLTMKLHELGILEKYNVKLLAATPEVIHRAEDRDTFKKILATIGIETAKSEVARSMSEGLAILERTGLPAILRPSFTLGGEGGGIARTKEEFKNLLEKGLFASPTKDVLVEESLLGWKEYELEVVRDKKDNVIIVCSIENFDPMGVHTGDSITVAPAQTLTDREYQRLRDYSIKIIRAIGVETGGSNIQFAVNPKDGRVICIEMNPRVSRSSALASKATGFPIARVATKLAIGYTLDELKNDITGTTPCSFEPSIDYVVTKIPRFDFEKFKPNRIELGTQMKSVGEVMAIGRSFQESLGKAIAGLENGLTSFFPMDDVDLESVKKELSYPSPKRLYFVAEAFRRDLSVDEVYSLSFIDPWFLYQIKDMINEIKSAALNPWPLSKDSLYRLKIKGWSDLGISKWLSVSESDVRDLRYKLDLVPSVLSVDTCAGEFEAKTPYHYSSYQGMDETRKPVRKSVAVLGSGPNRIGQGIEFDYCCVHAAFALKEMGYDSVMINSNPETVSTDFDISERLYFEPLTTEHADHIFRKEKPIGAIVQLGGQTPLKLTSHLHGLGHKILGTQPESIDWAEDRAHCDKIFKEMNIKGLKQPDSCLASGKNEALQKTKLLGYPCMVRPSYVLGGRGMKIVYNEADLSKFFDEALDVSDSKPVLIDRFLDHAIEVDVDALCDGKRAIIAGAMEHIEEAGIHSGDSACCIPPQSLSNQVLDQIRGFTKDLALKFKVVGLMNAQFAVQNSNIFILEVNPRASRTVPFISKAIKKPIVQYAVKLMLGHTLNDLGLNDDLDRDVAYYNVKAPVFVFGRFPESDILLGPEMKSTGEVMGRGKTFPEAYAKAMEGTGMSLPEKGVAFFSIADRDKATLLPIAKKLESLGFGIEATKGTAQFLNENGLSTKVINKVLSGSPHCVEAILSGKYSLVINTTFGDQSVKDSFSIRRAALEKRIPHCTVISAAKALVDAISERRTKDSEVYVLS